MTEDIYIVAAKRTPMGSMQGVFSSLTATELGSFAIKATLEQVAIDSNNIDEIYFGNVVSAGLKQSPARQAALGAGVDECVPTTTINKVCGSGMKAAMIARDQIAAGSANVVLVGGMESMSGAPYLLPKARTGMRMGHGEIKDSLFVDGLEDASSGALMGRFGQSTAERCDLSREAMDDFAITSLQRARNASDMGWFENEITTVTYSTKKGDVDVKTDEQPFKADPEKVSTLRPAFKKDGTVTAANSSSISDGAAALIIMSKSSAEKQGVKPLARIVAQASNAIAPEDFCLAPIGALKKVLTKANWSVDEVDLFEVNEAFAAVTIAAINELGLDAAKVNINGGACALGHPLGASGARLLVTLIYALKRTGKTKGVASLCIGGGEATAMAIEVL